VERCPKSLRLLADSRFHGIPASDNFLALFHLIQAAQVGMGIGVRVDMVGPRNLPGQISMRDGCLPGKEKAGHNPVLLEDTPDAQYLFA